MALELADELDRISEVYKVGLANERTWFPVLWLDWFSSFSYFDIQCLSQKVGRTNSKAHKNTPVKHYPWKKLIDSNLETRGNVLLLHHLQRKLDNASNKILFTSTTHGTMHALFPIAHSLQAHHVVTSGPACLTWSGTNGCLSVNNRANSHFLSLSMNI